MYHVNPDTCGCDTAFSTKGLVSRNAISYPDVEIPCSKTTFIIGGSGTGKTTLLRIFNQTETQTSGTVSLFGKDIDTIDISVLRKEVVLCGQDVFLFDDSIRGNFNEFRGYREEPPLSDDEMQAFLRICCVIDDLDKMCRKMSGGERARVFLAIHLSFAPKAIMLDEPTSALDRDTAAAVMGNVRSHCTENGITLIVVSHDRTIVDAFADSVIDLGGKSNG